MTRRDEVLSHHLAQALKPFQSAVERQLKLTFSVHRLRHSLNFNFILSGRVAGDIEKIVLPESLESGARRRRDELWKTTCFEIFIGRSDRNSYFEFNLSPSGDWNAYEFEKYRSGQRVAEHVHAPLLKIEEAAGGDMLSWHGEIAGGGELESLLKAPSLVLSATAVLEFKSGEHEYWALIHAGPKPDFHLRESFRLPL